MNSSNLLNYLPLFYYRLPKYMDKESGEEVVVV